MTLNDVFKLDGILKTKFPDYEIREGQVKMATLVERSLREHKSAVIEGATGVGKGFAYLIPAIINNVPIIVSTSNKSLQDQLDSKDLPFLKEALGLNISWTVLKGKSNYFCYEHYHINEVEIINKLLSNRALMMNDFSEAQVFYQKLGTWADTDETGDLEHCPFELPQTIRDLISCTNQTSHDKESPYHEKCFANKSRMRAKTSQIVLINHSLLALDISIRNETDGMVSILPETNLIVIDEAHMFEKASILAFSDEISIFSLLHLLNWEIVKKSVSKQELETVKKAFNSALEAHLPEKGSNGYYMQKKAVKFDNLTGVVDVLDMIIHKIETNTDLGTGEAIEAKIKEIVKEAKHLQTRLKALMEENENMLRWSEAKDDKNGKPIIKLKSVPLDISPLLKSGLFSKKTVVCTSATLSVHKSFDFFKEQVGMADCFELIVPSPFDYKRQALVYIPTEDNKIEDMELLIKMSRGNAFVLFTSYKDMRYCFETVQIPYPKFIQNSDQTRSQTLEEFKNTEGAVLFATKTFWEGVDIKGDKLRLVIIHKIPFENPYDLVFSSKCEQIDAKYGKKVSFMKYAIPDACIKLKQGVGRLIRSKDDKGVIALLDPRVNYSHSYKRQVLDSLPPSYITQQLPKVKNFYAKMYGFT